MLIIYHAEGHKMVVRVCVYVCMCMPACDTLCSMYYSVLNNNHIANCSFTLLGPSFKRQTNRTEHTKQRQCQ